MKCMWIAYSTFISASSFARRWNVAGEPKEWETFGERKNFMREMLIDDNCRMYNNSN